MGNVERHEFSGLPSNFPEWMAWFRHHGIDPDEVDAHGFVERDPEGRQIIYKRLVILAKRPNGAISYATDHNGVVRSDWSVQLEVDPLPFPVLKSKG